ncbi:glycosyltransferase family 2 protein [Candidatus Neomarinimicrobiota bacterium]
MLFNENDMSGGLNPASVTVIIPTLNRSDVVLATLGSLERQSVEGFNVLVVDQSDQLPELLKQLTSTKYNYRYHHLERKNLPNARNAGAKIATTELLVFIDDDVVLDEQFIESYINEFNRVGTDYWMIGGRIWEADSNIFRQTDRIVGGTVTCYGKTLKNFDTDKFGECDFAAGGNFGIYRERYQQLGGFDSSLLHSSLLEDADFSYRLRKAGGKIFFSPHPSLEHLRVTSGGTRNWSKVQVVHDRAYNTVIFFRRYRSWWHLPIVFLYVQAIAIKVVLQGQYPFSAIIFSIGGFLKAIFVRDIEPFAPDSH